MLSAIYPASSSACALQIIIQVNARLFGDTVPCLGILSRVALQKQRVKLFVDHGFESFGIGAACNGRALFGYAVFGMLPKLRLLGLAETTDKRFGSGLVELVSRLLLGLCLFAECLLPRMLQAALLIGTCFQV